MFPEGPLGNFIGAQISHLKQWLPIQHMQYLITVDKVCTLLRKERHSVSGHKTNELHKLMMISDGRSYPNSRS
jgi:hypothetical protein